MIQTWKIIYYETSSGSSPIYDFINSLNPKIQAKIANTFDLLEQYGTGLGFPHVKKISGTNLWELRILGSDNIRLFYILLDDRSFLLLHGFIKKKRKTGKKEISTALKRLEKHSTQKH